MNLDDEDNADVFPPTLWIDCEIGFSVWRISVISLLTEATFKAGKDTFSSLALKHK